MKVLAKEKLSPNKMKTPEGYLICTNAVLARTGKQEYLKSELFPDSDDDSIIEIDRKPEQVFADATLASFNYKPLTCEHPSENVNPENYKDLSVGYVTDVKKGRYENQDVILGTLVVTDPQCIEDIENGYRTDLSCGYDCDITDGDHPEQINIRGNHVALCMEGRAGIARIVDSKNAKIVKDAEPFVVGAQYVDKDNKKYQIIKIENEQITVNVNTKPNLFSEEVLKGMIESGYLKPVTEAKPADSTRVHTFDSYITEYVDRYRGITITLNTDGKYESTFKEKKYTNACLSQLKEQLDKAIEKDIENYSKQFDVKQMKPMKPNQVTDSASVSDESIDADEYEPWFYKKVSKILGKKIDKMSKEDPSMLDSNDTDEEQQKYITARYNAKKEMRSQYNAYKKELKEE